MPIIDSLHPRPLYLPLSVPKDLSERLIRVNGDPSSWWIGQFVQYLTRPQPHLQHDLDSAKAKLGFSNPCVGWVIFRFFRFYMTKTVCVEHIWAHKFADFEGGRISPFSPLRERLKWFWNVDNIANLTVQGNEISQSYLRREFMYERKKNIFDVPKWWDMMFSPHRQMIVLCQSDWVFQLGDNTFVIEWFAGINCIIWLSQI